MEDIVDDSIEMQVLPPAVFDNYLALGWRLLGRSIVRHNFSMCRGKICRTIPLRLRLDQLEWTRSQRQIIKRNSPFRIEIQPIRLTLAKQELFERHSLRFQERRPDFLMSFIGNESHFKPVAGMEINVFDDKKLIASSFFHLGEEAVSGTYCIYDPEYGTSSLGTFTMLLELQYAHKHGKKFYYHGYCYDVPSAFDYKLNFNHLEAMDWTNNNWYPIERVKVRRWIDLVTQEPDYLKRKNKPD